MKTRIQNHRIKTHNKIAHRNVVIGTFERLVSPKGEYALVCHTDRGVIVDSDRVGRRAFFLKWVDAPRSRTKGRFIYKVQFKKEDVEALVGQYDHLVIFLGGADYNYCVVTREQFLKMGVSVGGCIEVVYQRGNRKFRVAGGTVQADQPMLIQVRRFWHSPQADDTVFANAA